MFYAKQTQIFCTRNYLSLLTKYVCTYHRFYVIKLPRFVTGSKRHARVVDGGGGAGLRFVAHYTGPSRRLNETDCRRHYFLCPSPLDWCSVCLCASVRVCKCVYDVYLLLRRVYIIIRVQNVLCISSYFSTLKC